METLEAERVTLAAIAAGDARVFGAWAGANEVSLRLSLRSFAAMVDVEAVVQETLLRVWQVAPRFEHDGRPHALLRFAARTARNVAVSDWRRYGKAEHREALERELQRGLDVQPITPDPHLRAQLERCKDKLPGKPREALEQRLSADGTVDDATLAARLGTTLNTFLQNFTRARRFLAECLEKAGVHLDLELP